MENLYLEATQYTPEIKFDRSGNFSIFGKSYPENTFEFYEPVMDWLKIYLESPLGKMIVFNIEILYCNSSSSKLFFDLFDLLEEKSSHYDIEINWIYDEENESALETGEDFQDDFQKLNFNLVEK